MSDRTTDDDFAAQIRGAGLLTADILYYRPDHPTLLQSFMWQTMDVAPGFPRLERFLDFWKREIEAAIHSVRIAHADWIGPAEVRAVNGVFRLH
jgi:uncharacterized protein Usg